MLAAVAAAIGTTKESLLSFVAEGMSVPVGNPYVDPSVAEPNSYVIKVIELLGTFLSGGPPDTLKLVSFTKWMTSWAKMKSKIVQEYGYSSTVRDVLYVYDLTKLNPDAIDPDFISTLPGHFHSSIKSAI